MNLRKFKKQAKKFNVFLLLKNKKIRPRNRKKEIYITKYKQLYVLQKIEDLNFIKKAYKIFSENNLIYNNLTYNNSNYRMGIIINNNIKIKY